MPMTPQVYSKLSKSKPLNVYVVCSRFNQTKYIVTAKNKTEAQSIFSGVFYEAVVSNWDFRRVRTDKREVYRQDGETAARVG